ncbi:MAG: isoprenyl transferase [Coriobacteriaceae bacterium]|jgi:undecaprenyl diphosphate synthase|nr:isoprenyl transferase [Coriobacteriaceae bacterium]
MNRTLEDIFPHPPQGIDLALFDASRVPSHVAIIMDGNGRWAKQRGKNRLAGHQAGIEAVRESIRCASDLGIRYLTIYSFSSENWKRPEDEVKGLMNLFAKTMLAEVEGLHAENVRVMTIGHKDGLPKKTRKEFDDAWEMTKENTGMTLVVAVNYGGRLEIIDAIAAYAEAMHQALRAGEVPKPLSEEAFSHYLYTADIPDPDLLIRTSGEMRISNFLLWQLAYTEFYCTEVFWPDFDRYELLRALLDYQGRERRFGGVG